jgi:DNA ligase 1
MLTLAHTYRQTDNVDGYWVQPKLDGVRCVFDGKTFLSRAGKPFEPPAEWYEGSALAALQKEIGAPIDGELVCFLQIAPLRGGPFGKQLVNFNSVVSVVRKKLENADMAGWAEIAFVAFDIVTDEPCSYRERYSLLEKLEKAETDHSLFIMPIVDVVDSGDDQCGWLASAALNGWEGVMLRNPDAPYERKRTRNLLKVKPMADEEFVVTGMQAGTGKHAGRMGALLCQREGKEFKVGTGFTDADRELRDWIGKTITVEYFELTPRGVPRHPRFKGVRDYE